MKPVTPQDRVVLLLRDAMFRSMTLDPDDLAKFVADITGELGQTLLDGDASDGAGWMSPEAANALYLAEMDRRYQRSLLPPDQQKILRWPWDSWNDLILPLEAGAMCLLSAPDGVGKTMLVEHCADHWQNKGFQVAYIHLELSPMTMLDRQVGRMIGVPMAGLRYGPFNQKLLDRIRVARETLANKKGKVHFLYCPEASVERILAEMNYAKEVLGVDAVIIDYINLITSGSSHASKWDKMEDAYTRIKSRGAVLELPTMAVAQMSKVGKQSGKQMDRNAIYGPAAFAAISNIIILANRRQLSDDDEEGSPTQRYSNFINIYVDKNTFGGTGKLDLYFDPHSLSIGEPTGKAKSEPETDWSNRDEDWVIG